jgi:hypothetical protein
MRNTRKLIQAIQKENENTESRQKKNDMERRHAIKTVALVVGKAAGTLTSTSDGLE